MFKKLARERGNGLLRWLDKYFGIPLVIFLGILRSKRSMPKNIKRIGVLFFGAIGDSVLAFPSILDLQEKYKSAEITIFMAKSNVVALPLFSCTSNVQVFSVTNSIKFIRNIRKYKFDALVDYSPWIRISAVFAFFSNAKFTVGFSTPNQFRHYVYDKCVNHSCTGHEIDNYRSLVSALGVASKSMPRVILSEESKIKILDLNLQNYVVLHPWASGYKSELKEWPLERWAALAEYLIKNGYLVVITGGNVDRSSSNDLVNLCQCPSGKLVSFAGSLSLMEAAALLSNASFMVTVNTGIMHLGAALDVPMVALHGPTNPNRWGPVSKKAIIISPKGVPCGYLNLGFEYIKSGFAQECMKYISVESVIDSCNKVSNQEIAGLT